MQEFLVKLLVRWYIKSLRKTSKLRLEDEFQAYLFRDSESITMAVKNEMHTNTLQYFDATGEKSRWIKKGQALAYQLLLEKHNAAMAINKKVEKAEKKRHAWERFIVTKRTK